MLETFSPFINGQPLSADGRDVRPILSPVTEEPCAQFVCATGEDAKLAVQGAMDAFGPWSVTSGAERGAVLHDIAKLVRANGEKLAQQITLEQGKTLDDARLELSGVADMFAFYGDVASTFAFRKQVDSEAARRQIDLVPVGPVIIITTWNFPVETAAVHLAPALAAGCSAVILANSDTPSSVALLMDLIAQVDLPKGCVNLLMGDSPLLSKCLIEHPATRHLSYTGSVQVGRILASQCGAQIMGTTLELGGNAPAIVLPGADVEQSVKALMGKRFWNAGQVCTAPNRVYVHDSLHDDFAKAAGDFARTLTVGPGDDPATTMAPLANRERVNTMQRIAEDAKAKGATVILDEPSAHNAGTFYAPRVFANVPDDALGMKEEIFGPIACIAPYSDLEEVIARANDCELALSGYVQGPDQEQAEAVAARLQVGSVAVNQMTTAFIDVPFGGMKISGQGSVGGESAVMEYLFPRLTAAKA